MTEKYHSVRLILGDSFKVMAGFDEGSLQAVVTDPPYLISFMNKKWDESLESGESQAWHEAWLTEAHRILIPGGVIKSFSATRTFHRMAAAMRKVGFCDLRLEAWVYGSGFPKSLNVGKALEKTADLAKEFDGYGTALKPAWEPFVVGRKSYA